jgi:retinoid hydroxylase
VPLGSVRDLPSPSALPLLGHVREVLGHPGRFLLEGYRRYGPLFRFRVFGITLVAMLGPEANRLILAAEQRRFSHALGYAMTRKVLGDGLLFQDGDVHKRNRTLMTPAFHSRGVQQYFDLMVALAREHAGRWANEGEGPMYDRFRRLTFEIAARLILGCREDVDVERVSEMNDRLGKGSAAFLRVNAGWTTYGRGIRARDELRAVLRRVVRGRREAPGSDALGLLMRARDERGEALSEDELVDQAVILIFAGHETTTSMLTSLLLALRDHPQTLERLIREQREVVGAADLRLDHLKDLKDLDLVLKEVERLWPPISLCQRGVVEEVEFAETRLPPGTMVVYSPWATHRLGDVFRDPERFDPDRFAPPREEHKAAPYSLIGFGGGPRLCIGQAFAQLEMKIVASILLGEFRWQLREGDPRLAYVPTLHPGSGLPGVVGRR